MRFGGDVLSPRRRANDRFQAAQIGRGVPRGKAASEAAAIRQRLIIYRKTNTHFLWQMLCPSLIEVG